MSQKRKKKFVVWLHNKVDSRDDEWVAVMAKSEKEAVKRVTTEGLYDDLRFDIGVGMPVSEFNEMMGGAGYAGKALK